MYAVIETGGKQYRVEVGTELEVELLDVEPGETVTLERVLLVSDADETAVGRPVVANAAVEAEVLRRDRGDKVIVFKYRPKARRRVKKGHRQDHTVLRITDVRLDGKSAAEARRKADDDARTERQRLEEAAARQAAADAALAARLAEQAGATPPKPARRTGRTVPSGGTAEPQADATTEAPAAQTEAATEAPEPLESGAEPTATAGDNAPAAGGESAPPADSTATDADPPAGTREDE